MKKLIALVIVAVMLLSMMPMMALAADTIYYVTGEDLDPAWGWNAAAQKMEKEGDVYCPVCRKVLHVVEGQTIPRCCGRVMEMLD